ncbi:MAG: M23 family metallopeptidase, partial [Bacteroidales bacterium]|nr:M23 family metallopeptidase [Bacteroidales bacterium]
MNLKQFSLSAIVMALTLISAPTPSRAQDTTIKNKHQAELLVPRPGREPVKSLNGRTDALDTLDTADPFIKILLFPDYTWKYWKDPSYARDSKIFNEYWTHERPDPYGVELSELPNEIALWIVDTLSSYRCPVIGAPSSRFGYRHRRRHQGVDIPLQIGTPVYAAFDGKVRVSKYHKGYGNLVVVRHDNG